MSTLRVPDGEKIEAEPIPEGMIVFQNIDRTGDTKHFFDADVEKERKAAKEMFDDLKKKGWKAFQTKIGGPKGGTKGRQIFNFDEIEGGAVTFVPPIVGG